MKIEMKIQMSGTRDGVDWPAPGETITVPDHEAEVLIAQKSAVPASSGESKADKPAKIDDILAEVDGDPDKAAAALELENQAKKPRSSLVEQLEAIIAS